MTRSVFALVFVLLDYVHSAPAVSEMVWLKDVTNRDQANTRSFEDNQLPDQLTFHLKRRSGDLTLTLKKNYDIDPNADIYVVQDIKNGQPRVTKTNILEKGDIAYYQDVKNGAYITVRCVRRFNQQCNRVINGNMRIERRMYYLRPAKTEIASRNILEVQELIGKRYMLLDETYMDLETVNNQDSSNINTKHIQDEREALLRHFIGQHKRNVYGFPDALSLSRNVADWHDDMVSDTGRQLKTEYNVKVAVLIDLGIWNRHSAEVQDVHALFVSDEVKLIIREAYSHIMNGVNLHYKTIDDPSISINIILQDFIFLKCSEVISANRNKYLEARDCLAALEKWDHEIGISHLPVYDHAMFFTSTTQFGTTVDKPWEKVFMEGYEMKL
ncbi:hypothetical protein ACJMK2_004178 [Sinanodonta woodiana]|uniref:Uncharacterized protein n=1 Tax=Sinanodonta woodiana TaxID=1069815 RepID=A0ABD3Y0E2_SINWO